MAFNHLKKKLEPLFRIDQCKNILENKKKCIYQGIGESLTSFLLDLLAQNMSKIVCITPTHDEANRLYSDLNTLSESPCHLLEKTLAPKHRYSNPHLSIFQSASKILGTIQQQSNYIILTSVEFIGLEIFPSKDFFDQRIILKKGEKWDSELLITYFQSMGYREMEFVESHCDFAIRGGIIDIFPASSNSPVRIDFYDNEIDSLRYFDIITQRHTQTINSLWITPIASETKALLNGNSFMSMLDRSATTLALVDWDIAVQNYMSFIDQKPLSNYTSTPLDKLLDKIKLWQKQIYINYHDKCQAPDFQFYIKKQPTFSGNFYSFIDHLAELQKKEIHTSIACISKSQGERLYSMLDTPEHQLLFSVVVGKLSSGFSISSLKMGVYTEHQIFNRPFRPQKVKNEGTRRLLLGKLKSFKSGDYIVHTNHGIGQFMGLNTLKFGKSEVEAVQLRFAENTMLYVNCNQLYYIHRFMGGDGIIPQLSKIGSTQWSKKIEKAKKKVKEIAEDLLKVEAKRKINSIKGCARDTPWQNQLEASFEYEETEDQTKAIEMVKLDMENPSPMNRLVCGDVGFGKTEVAIRAAFKAVMSGKQVAILVPTTILVKQHIDVFNNRMKKFPIKILPFSRFQNTKTLKDNLDELEKGSIDIAIGTHRLLSKDVKFKNLGLLIIDEEQQFGVLAKEKIKSFYESVDILTMTATPIPRTFQMALSGIRKMSIIRTPPPNRLPIVTEICTPDDQRLTEIIEHELARKGQILLIHNRIQTLEGKAKEVQKLIPKAKLKWAHGRMPSKQLDTVFTQLYNREIDILVSTNIIENGMDLPNANTIIIDHAEKMGLAELHQLRGRVGRLNLQAYCYLLAPSLSSLKEGPRERLLVIEQFSDLSSGFEIAFKDLAIRGVGNILGEEQSGFIYDVGFEMYNRILKQTIADLEKKENISSNNSTSITYGVTIPDTKIICDFRALIEADYIKNDHERFDLYQKLSDATSITQIDQWVEEIKDRFGPLPSGVFNLMLVSKIKFLASHLMMEKVTIRSRRMWLMTVNIPSQFGNQTVDSTYIKKMINLLNQQKQDHSPEWNQKDDKIRFIIHNIHNLQESFIFLKKLTEISIAHS